MSQPVIRVENVCKQYRLGKIGTGTLAHDLNRWWHTVRGKDDPYLKVGEENDRTRRSGSEYVWALNQISFDVNRGDVVGIIGRNGAGKSTLLKLLSRTTLPTAGQIKVKGRVASLLEVGTGFHPELTGRENIFLNGAILGMTKREIKSKFDEIVGFAGVEKYVDTPVKRYSSGMYVRLAFAVAAHLEPEILIVDEVLAVGDAEFQKKALGKMKSVSRSEGRTVLFVSHNMQSISTLTKTCMVMSNGSLVFQGPTEEAISVYLNEKRSSSLEYKMPPSVNQPSITEVRLSTSLPFNTQVHGQSMEVHFKIFTPRPIQNAGLSFQIVDRYGAAVTHLWAYDSQLPFCRESGYHTLICRIPFARLYMGKYFLTVHFAETNTRTKLQTIENICPFEITMFGMNTDYKWNEGAAQYLEDSVWLVSRAGT